MTAQDIEDAVLAVLQSDAGKQAIADAVLTADEIPLLEGTYSADYIKRNPTFTVKSTLAQILKRSTNPPA